MKTTSIISSMLCGTMLLFGTAVDADAATIRVKCEKRVNRSRISVDGNDLAPGLYQARAISGSKQKTSGVKAADGDEVEFDFDSNPANIAAGATAIPANFIQNRQVTGKILNQAGNTVIADTVRCK